MGLSASQARFLELTARKSNVEYEAQQITFQRLQLANDTEAITTKYQEKTSNTKLMYSYNDGTGIKELNLTYSNYKNYMNNNKNTAQQAMYLVSSTGNKMVVASKEDMYKMIETHQKSNNISSIIAAKEKADKAETDSSITLTAREKHLVDLFNENGYEIQTTTSEGDPEKQIKTLVKNGEQVFESKEPMFTPDDFIIVDDLDDVDEFQECIQEGVYYFATLSQDDEGNNKFTTEMWETIGGGAIMEVLDTSDDAAAQAEYDKETARIQKIDNRLQLELERLETERKAIETEMDSVSQVIKDNIEETYKIFNG